VYKNHGLLWVQSLPDHFVLANFQACTRKVNVHRRIQRCSPNQFCLPLEKDSTPMKVTGAGWGRRLRSLCAEKHYPHAFVSSLLAGGRRLRRGDS
jgi:hypothetical protein